MIPNYRYVASNELHESSIHYKDNTDIQNFEKISPTFEVLSGEKKS